MIATHQKGKKMEQSIVGVLTAWQSFGSALNLTAKSISIQEQAGT